MITQQCLLISCILESHKIKDIFSSLSFLRKYYSLVVLLNYMFNSASISKAYCRSIELSGEIQATYVSSQTI